MCFLLFSCSFFCPSCCEGCSVALSRDFSLRAHFEDGWDWKVITVVSLRREPVATPTPCPRRGPCRKGGIGRNRLCRKSTGRRTESALSWFGSVSSFRVGVF